MDKINRFFSIIAVLSMMSILIMLVGILISFVMGTAIMSFMIVWASNKIPGISLEDMDNENLGLYKELTQNYPIDYWIE